MPKGESNKFVYDTSPETGKPLTTHQWYDGTPHPWEFKRVWHLEPSLSDPDTVYAGVEDAALFRSTDGGQTWRELAGLRGHGSGPSWQPGAGGMCLHTILLDPTHPGRIFVAISAAGTFRTDDAGRRGGRSTGASIRCTSRTRRPRWVTACTASPCNPSRPNVLFMQKHWDVMRSDDAGESWREISGNLPTDFGFPIDVHAHEPETIYVVPITSDSEHYVPDGKLRVYRSRTGGERVGGAHERPAAAPLLRQRAARRHGGRRARSVRRLLRHHRRAGLRVGRRRGPLGAHRPGPAVRGVRRGPDAEMIRVVLPAHLRTLARVDGEVKLDVAGAVTLRVGAGCPGGSYPMLRGTIRDHVTQQRRAFVRFFACEEDLSHEPVDVALPDAVAKGAEPFLIVGAMAGG